MICAGVLALLAACGPVIESVQYISLEGYLDAKVVERAQGTPTKPHLFVGELPIRYEIEREGYTLVLDIHPNYSRPQITLGVYPDSEYQIGFRTTAGWRPEPCVKWVQSSIKLGHLFFHNWCHKKDNDGDIDMHLRFTVFDQNGVAIADEAIPYTIKWNGFYGYIEAI